MLTKLPVQGQLGPECRYVLGTTEHRWYTPSNLQGQPVALSTMSEQITLL